MASGYLTLIRDRGLRPGLRLARGDGARAGPAMARRYFVHDLARAEARLEVLMASPLERLGRPLRGGRRRQLAEAAAAVAAADAADFARSLDPATGFAPGRLRVQDGPPAEVAAELAGILRAARRGRALPLRRAMEPFAIGLCAAWLGRTLAQRDLPAVLLPEILRNALARATGMQADPATLGLALGTALAPSHPPSLAPAPAQSHPGRRPGAGPAAAALGAAAFDEGCRQSRRIPPAEVLEAHLAAFLGAAKAEQLRALRLYRRVLRRPAPLKLKRAGWTLLQAGYAGAVTVTALAVLSAGGATGIMSALLAVYLGVGGALAVGLTGRPDFAARAGWLSREALAAEESRLAALPADCAAAAASADRAGPGASSPGARPGVPAVEPPAPPAAPSPPAIAPPASTAFPAPVPPPSAPAL